MSNLGTQARTTPSDAATSRVQFALREWVGVLGPDHVVVDGARLDAAETATFATSSRVHAVLRPADRVEVQECMRIANRMGVALYPVSSGKNWGYGSSVPAGDGALLDLGRLNRILDYDEKLAYVTIEPGVTQRQLSAFLSERGGHLWMDATGASPDCSIIGNTLERGFGHTPMGDHSAAACGFEVVLPTGACLQTGFSRFAGHRVGSLSRLGLGPSLDGLLTQSNLGIVTRMSVWLMPTPEAFEAFFFSCRDEAGLGLVVDALRPLRLNGTLRSTIHIGNDYKVVAATGTRPPEAPDPSAPIDLDVMRAMRERLGIGAWNGSGGLYGTRAQVREAKRQVRRALRGRVARLQFVDDRLLGIMRRFATPFRWVTGWDVSRTLAVLEPVYNLLKGRPTDATIASAYWRKPSNVVRANDPDRDRCGLLWCSPVVPATSADLSDVTAVASTVLLEHGFDPQISVSLANERSAIAVITISYDRDRPGEDARASRCYETLTRRFMASGYPPYRLNVASMGAMNSDESYAAAIQSIKRALDPNGVLAPGRYDCTPPHPNGWPPA